MINQILKWVATLVTVLGALAVVYQLDPLNIYFLNGASILWVIWALRISEWSIVVVNVAMLLIYAWGLVLRVL